LSVRESRSFTWPRRSPKVSESRRRIGGGGPHARYIRRVPASPHRARVVITTYERLHLLRLALRAWRRQTCLDFALTVADDGSGPETGEFIRAFAASAPFPVKHVWWKNEGFRRAGILNESVRQSDGEPLLVFTDGDCVPPATFLAGHLAAHGPRTFAVGGAFKIPQAPSATLNESSIDRGDHERLGTRADRLELGWRAWKSHVGVWLHQRRRPKVVGLNIGIDRSLFEEVNGYDEAFVGYGLEDSDLRDRVMATRPRPTVRVLYGKNDTIHLWHPPAATAGKQVNRSYYETARPSRCVKGLHAAM
jgi:glycosyltransferase involved in cell wall biosynthesis